jgi:hypothetical protein
MLVHSLILYTMLGGLHPGMVTQPQTQLAGCWAQDKTTSCDVEVQICDNRCARARDRNDNREANCFSECNELRDACRKEDCQQQHGY